MDSFWAVPNPALTATTALPMAESVSNTVDSMATSTALAGDISLA